MIYIAYFGYASYFQILSPFLFKGPDLSKSQASNLVIVKPRTYAELSPASSPQGFVPSPVPKRPRTHAARIYMRMDCDSISKIFDFDRKGSLPAFPLLLTDAICVPGPDGSEDAMATLLSPTMYSDEAMSIWTGHFLRSKYTKGTEPLIEQLVKCLRMAWRVPVESMEQRFENLWASNVLDIVYAIWDTEFVVAGLLKVARIWLKDEAYIPDPKISKHDLIIICCLFLRVSPSLLSHTLTVSFPGLWRN